MSDSHHIAREDVVRSAPERSGSEPLDLFIGELSERSMSWVARRAQSLGVAVASRSTAWIDTQLAQVADDLRGAPSKAEVLRAWKQTARASSLLAVEGEYRRRAGLRTSGAQIGDSAGRRLSTDGADTQAHGWVELPRHQRELLGEQRAEHLMRVASEQRRRLERRSDAFLERSRARLRAALPTLDDHALELLAQYVALRREQLARVELEHLRRLRSPVRGLRFAGREGLVAERRTWGSVNELVERCALSVGSERRELVVEHAAALVPEMLRLAPEVLTAYAGSLRERLAHMDTRSVPAVAIVDRKHRVDDDLHAWRSDLADAAAKNAARHGLTGKTRRELARIAVLETSEARRLEAGLAAAVIQLRDARVRRIHPDNLTDDFARLIAAEVAITRRQDPEAAPTLRRAHDERSRDYLARGAHPSTAGGGLEV